MAPSDGVDKACRRQYPKSCSRVPKRLLSAYPMKCNLRLAPPTSHFIWNSYAHPTNPLPFHRQIKEIANLSFVDVSKRFHQSVDKTFS
ncbi:hypothetical protein RRG08_052785 [Elysia crispata]|uniref:Uncharacterized protein n=1 Tax=Elysia crispata TaxID=231223 RepID=A0AAE1EB06_9GAST|nr:hypothetical protein RRG08_052785 [Elysia crispata]